MSLKINTADLVRKPIDPSTGREYEKCHHALFTGGILAEEDPVIAIKLYDSILQQYPDTAIMLMDGIRPERFNSDDEFREACDRFRAQWESLGRPEVIFAGMKCYSSARKHMPDIPAVTVFETLNYLGIGGGCNSEKYSFLSRYPMEDYEEVNEAVKELAEDMGVEFVPLAPLTKPLDEYSEDELETYIEGIEAPLLVYAFPERNLFKEHGQDAAHILELIFGMSPCNRHLTHVEDCEDAEDDETQCDGDCANCALACAAGLIPDPLPDDEQRKQNRIELKESMLQLFWGE